MRRDFVIFYFENNKIDNAVRRCLRNKTKPFYCEIVLVLALNDFPDRIEPEPTHRFHKQKIVPELSLRHDPYLVASVPREDGSPNGQPQNYCFLPREPTVNQELKRL
jgi:hypothetical protein